MAISHALLKEKVTRNRCILCRSAIEKATIGNLCNSCKDGFTTNFPSLNAVNKEFAM